MLLRALGGVFLCVCSECLGGCSVFCCGVLGGMQAAFGCCEAGPGCGVGGEDV